MASSTTILFGKNQFDFRGCDNFLRSVKHKLHTSFCFAKTWTKGKKVGYLEGETYLT